MSVPHEIAKTSWKRMSSLRLRMCRDCEKLFPSSSAGERQCARCVRKEEDARARAFIPNQETVLKDYLDTIFDGDMVTREKERKDRDSERRLKRQSHIT